MYNRRRSINKWTLHLSKPILWKNSTFNIIVIRSDKRHTWELWTMVGIQRTAFKFWLWISRFISLFMFGKANGAWRPVSPIYTDLRFLQGILQIEEFLSKGRWILSFFFKVFCNTFKAVLILILVQPSNVKKKPKKEDIYRFN